MRIIHIALGKANPERMNGVNKVVHQLASTQKALGYQVELWGIANDLEPTYPKRNFSTTLFQQHKNKSLSVELISAIKQLSKDTVVHIHGAFILEFFKITNLLTKQGIPYVFTPHGSFAEAAMEKNKWIKKIYFQLLEKRLIKNAKAVQLLGINEFNHLGKLVASKNKKLIPNGIDLKKIPLSKSDSKSTDFIFGFCGRIDTYHKGLDLLLKGFKIFTDKGGHGRLELIGDGKDRPKLQQFAQRLGIADRVVFHGALFGQAKFDVLYSFDVFLHTSRMEGFPMAVLEAAALSIPCLTSEATNVNSYIQQYDAGFALPVNIPESIASAMESAAFMHKFDAQQLQRKGANARKMVEHSFDWKNIAEELVETYAS